MKSKAPHIIFFALAVIYILFGYGVIISNDSVTNVEQITNINLWSRSSHFSFHLFGIIFYLFFSKLIGLSAITAIEIMLSVFSAGAAAALYQLTLNKYGDARQALITVIIYSLASGVFRFSCQVEYLVLVPSFGIISLYFYSIRKYIVSGIILGLGLLVSPFALLFTPTFLLFTSLKDLFKKNNLIFAAGIIVVYAGINMFTYQETLTGHWSYGWEINYYSGIWSEINHLRLAAIYFYGYLRSFNFILLVIPFALFYLYKTNKELFYVLIFTIIIHLPVAIPEARYGGYQMTAYPLIAVSMGYFLNKLLDKYRYAVFSLILLYAGTNIFLVTSERDFFRDLKDTYVQLSNNLPDRSALIVYQANKPIEKVYAPNLQVYGLLSDYQNKMEVNNPGYVPADLNKILNENKDVYLLESGVSMPDDHLKLLVSGFTKNQGAKVKGFALEKILAVQSSLQIEKLKDYPLDVYKLTKSRN